MLEVDQQCWSSNDKGDVCRIEDLELLYCSSSWNWWYEGTHTTDRPDFTMLNFLLIGL